MEENKYIQLLKKHWSKGASALLVFALVLVWGERLMGKKQGGVRQDYLSAHHTFERFQQGRPIELESLLATEAIVKKHKELAPSYEAMLAHLFLMQEKKELGVEYATRALVRNRAFLPPSYLAYAETSLLIAEERFDEALEAAHKLEVEEGSLLEAFNLVRLCALEKGGWERVRAHPKCATLAALFQEGAVTFEDFLEKQAHS